MTIFGKILIVFNLLVAGAFAYFATQDWRGRQTITAAGVKHALVVEGLPLEPGKDTGDPDEIAFEVRMAGGYQTETISKPLLNKYFESISGNSLDAKRDAELNLGGPNTAVTSQVGEVKRVKEKTEAALAAAGDDADKKLKLLTAWLQYQPEVYEERERVLKMIKDKDVKGLEELLAAKFAAVLDAPKTAVDAEATTLVAEEDKTDPEKLAGKVAKVDASRQAPLDGVERRIRLAHLLVHLDQDPEWQKRVAMIVGMRRYTPVLVAQGLRFRDMTARAQLAVIADQAAFLAYERELLKLAMSRTDLANHQEDLKRKWTEQHKKDHDFVGQRKTQLAEIQKRLAKIKAEVDDLLAKQTAIEAALFEVQREVAITIEQVYKLEDQLDARERELLKLPPKVEPK